MSNCLDFSQISNYDNLKFRQYSCCIIKELPFLIYYRSNVTEGAALTGIIKLLAGVKLCTGRPMTNYEDKHVGYEIEEGSKILCLINVLLFLA